MDKHLIDITEHAQKIGKINERTEDERLPDPEIRAAAEKIIARAKELLEAPPPPLTPRTILPAGK
jgi:hypothetical protein